LRHDVVELRELRLLLECPVLPGKNTPTLVGSNSAGRSTTATCQGSVKKRPWSARSSAVIWISPRVRE